MAAAAAGQRGPPRLRHPGARHHGVVRVRQAPTRQTIQVLTTYNLLVTNYCCQVPGAILRQRLRPLQARGPAVVRRGGDGDQVSCDWWRAVT